jgi:type I restriction enzyme S subunit
MTLHPYPAYKDSGVDWLGEIPSHWEIQSVWSLFELGRGRVISKGEISDNPGHYPVYSSQTKNSGIMGSLGTFDFEGNYLTWTTDGAHAGTVFQRSGRFNCTNVCGTLKPKSQSTSLSCFLYILNNTTKQYVRLDINPKLMNNVMARIRVQVPPHNEQLAIGNFLDAAEVRIRRYIRAKQKLIKLLNEQKQAIIQQAVTRGLNPDAPMKDSGVEWLGEIPAHWEVVLNQRIFKENIRPYEGTNEIQLSLSQVDGLIPKSELKEKSLQTTTFKNWKITIPGDLVLNRFKAHLGVFFATTMRGIVTFHYGVFEPRIKLRTLYYEYLYHTAPFKEIYAWRSNGMTVGLQNLSNQNFYNVHTLVPPLDEQSEILEYIESKTVTLNRAMQATKHEIDLMREYRTRLIADVVTGKVDVRGLAFDLPQEFAEEALLDAGEDDLLEGDDSMLDGIDELEGRDE